MVTQEKEKLTGRALAGFEELLLHIYYMYSEYIELWKGSKPIPEALLWWNISGPLLSCLQLEWEALSGLMHNRR